MTTPKFEECILQIIDQLRMRKARPDLKRICHMASRRYGMKHLDTEAQLEKLVDGGVVVKVDYKRNISYRNAVKWKKRPFGRKLVNSFTTTNNIFQALRALTDTSKGSDDSEGASLKDIEKWLTSEIEDFGLTKNQLKVCLLREAENGAIKKLANGNFVLVPGQKDGRPRTNAKGIKLKQGIVKKKEATSANNASVATATGSPKRGRPPSKRRRIKKTLPDFEMTSVKKKTENSDDEDETLCDYCQMPRKQKGEGILTCKECKATAHPSCMGYGKGLARRALESPWQCIDCKTCYVCEDSGDPEMMLFCDACDKGYHMHCHVPPLEKKPSGKWVCSKCQNEGNSDSASENDDLQDSTLEDSQVTEGGGASCLPTPCDSPVSDEDDEPIEPPRKRKVPEGRKKLSESEGRKKSESEKHSDLNIVDGNYPDASQWKVDDVVRFFVNLGYKEQAQSLKEQEIDGQSLLLMKRSDVLTGLSIKLGPALKMYQHVMKLQTTGMDLDDFMYS